MTTNIFRGGAPSFYQEKKVTVTNVGIGDVFTLTFVDDNDLEGEVEFEATEATEANVYSGLAAAITNSSSPIVARVKATDATTYLTLKAATAGQRFNVSGQADNGDSSDAETLTITDVRDNSGPNDYQCPGNWSLGVTPVDTNDVIIAENAPDILWGLKNLTVTLNSFTRQDGHKKAIGRWGTGQDVAPLVPLRIKTGALTLGGTGNLVAVDVDDSAITPVVRTTSSAPLGYPASVYIVGTALTGLDQRSGACAIAGAPGQTATVDGDFAVAAGSSLYIGPGATITGCTASVAGATVTTWKGFTAAFNVYNGGVWIQEAGNITQGNFFQGSQFRPMGAGTHTAINTKGSVLFDKTGSMAGTTITTLTQDGDLDIVDPAGKLTITTRNPTAGFETRYRPSSNNS